MTDHPIIFSAQMIKALLAGRKSMTRRYAWRTSGQDDAESFPTVWQKAKPGDRLWVRENLTCIGDGIWRWAADDEHVYSSRESHSAMRAWAHHQERGSVPSIHMPRWASRLTLVVTATKIEQVREISEADALAEGIDTVRISHGKVADAYGDLWKRLNGEESWDDNPEVVVVSFTVHKQNIDAMKEAAAA